MDTGFKARRQIECSKSPWERGRVWKLPSSTDVVIFWLLFNATKLLKKNQQQQHFDRRAIEHSPFVSPLFSVLLWFVSSCPGVRLDQSTLLLCPAVRPPVEVRQKGEEEKQRGMRKTEGHEHKEVGMNINRGKGKEELVSESSQLRREANFTF